MARVVTPEMIFKKDSFLVVLLLIVGYIAILTLANLQSITIIAVLMLIGALSHIHMRFISWVGLELTMFVTITLGWLFGPIIGMVGGVITIVVADILGGCVAETSLISYVVTGVIGLLAGFLAGSDIVSVGILLTILYNSVACSMSIALGLAIPVRAIFFGITHVLFTGWVFWMVGPLLTTIAG